MIKSVFMAIRTTRHEYTPLRGRCRCERSGTSGAVIGPLLHQTSAFLQRITASVCPFGGVTNDVRQRRLSDLAGKDETSPHQSRKEERKPCTVTSTFIRRRSMSIAMIGPTFAGPSVLPMTVCLLVATSRSLITTVRPSAGENGSGGRRIFCTATPGVNPSCATRQRGRERYSCILAPLVLEILIGIDFRRHILVPDRFELAKPRMKVFHVGQRQRRKKCCDLLRFAGRHTGEIEHVAHALDRRFFWRRFRGVVRPGLGVPRRSPRRRRFPR